MITLEKIIFREGLTAIVSVKLPNPEFEGQTKEKLGSQEAMGAVQDAVRDKLQEYQQKIFIYHASGWHNIKDGRCISEIFYKFLERIINE